MARRNPDTGQWVGIAALVGVAVYVLYFTLFRRNDFKDITATYDGVLPSTSGPSIPKTVGENTTVVLRFAHMGVGGKFQMGIGLAPAIGLTGEFGPVQGWIKQVIQVERHADWATVEATVSGPIPNIPGGKKDALKFVQTETGQLDDRGKYMKVSDWDRNCYNVSGTQVSDFQNFQATYG